MAQKGFTSTEWRNVDSKLWITYIALQSQPPTLHYPPLQCFVSPLPPPHLLQISQWSTIFTPSAKLFLHNCLSAWLFAAVLQLIEDIVVYEKMGKSMNENKPLWVPIYPPWLIDFVYTCGWKGHQTYKQYSELIESPLHQYIAMSNVEPGLVSVSRCPRARLSRPLHSCCTMWSFRGKKQWRHQRKAEREEEGRRAGGERIATVITNKNHLSHLCNLFSFNMRSMLKRSGSLREAWEGRALG